MVPDLVLCVDVRKLRQPTLNALICLAAAASAMAASEKFESITARAVKQSDPRSRAWSRKANWGKPWARGARR